MIHLSDVCPVPLVSLGLNPDSEVFATDCRFEQGKRYLVAAPSGRGKSTLLHCIYGLRSDYSGSVLVDGRDVSAFTPDDWAEMRQQHLSIVFQDLRLFPQLTAWENLWLKAELRPYAEEAMLRRWATQLHVGDLLMQPAHQLSYGQRQRIAIIRALSQPFRMLLLDEPFSHLDPLNAEIALHLILEACELQKAGLILVSLGEDSGIDFDKKLVL